MLRGNNPYLLERIQRLLAVEPTARVLDFGCGAGELVAEARRYGLEVFGADTFYEGGNSRQKASDAGLLGTVIMEMNGDLIPFPDGYFRLIVANEVFEHVENLAESLRELNRVLALGGTMLALFPTREVWRENHCGIWLAHWFPKGSKWQYRWLVLCRTLGFGKFKSGKSVRVWAGDIAEWLRRFTCYRSRRETMYQFSRFFEVSLVEDDWLAFCLRDHQVLGILARPLLWASFTRPFVKEFSRRHKGLVLMAQKDGL